MNIIVLVSSAIRIFGNILEWLIFIRIIASWLPIPRGNKLMQLLYTLTEPVLSPIRSIIRNSPFGGPGMMLDFSPILAYVFIEVVTSAITYGLLSLAR